MGVSRSSNGAIEPTEFIATPSSTLLLPRAFYERDVLTCARDLIGCELVWGSSRGRVVETEAYSAVGDEASHVFTRPSTRVYMATHRPGSAYVYFNYGVHWMLNVLVKANPHEVAVPENGIILIRAIEPLAGLEALYARRQGANQSIRAVQELCSGPGKLAQAFGILGRDHGRDLTIEPFGFAPRAEDHVGEVESDVRIGISRSQELPWRFLLKGSPFVSRKPKRV